MELLYLDDKLLVCVKPAGALSTDEPSGLPELCRAALGDPAAPLYPVHRLDRAAAGVMVLARTRRAAGDLGRAVMAGRLEKEYFAALRGCPTPQQGSFTDFLLRDRTRRMSCCVPEGTPGAQRAALDYRVLARTAEASLVRIALRTGRTHQIRVQFASRGLPLLGDGKYGRGDGDGCGLALWSCRLAFDHPKTGERLEFFLPPPAEYPWTEFESQWKQA